MLSPPCPWQAAHLMLPTRGIAAQHPLSLGHDPPFEEHVAARLTSPSLLASSGQWIPYNCLLSRGRWLCFWKVCSREVYLSEKCWLRSCAAMHGTQPFSLVQYSWHGWCYPRPTFTWYRKGQSTGPGRLGVLPISVTRDVTGKTLNMIIFDLRVNFAPW